MIIIAAILVIDQIIKIEVKTNMTLGEKIRITDWFYIFFIENNGMAYGMQFINKLFLTTFRIVAVTVIAFYITSQVKKGARTGYIVCLAMVLAGAAGNIIDCVFYGQIFSESTPSEVAHFVPFGEGYQSLLQGRVVDMLYFPLVSFTWPDWVPFVGGSDYLFFSPIFNFADSYITVGVILILLFFRKELNTINFGMKEEEKAEGEENADGDGNANGETAEKATQETVTAKSTEASVSKSSASKSSASESSTSETKASTSEDSASGADNTEAAVSDTEEASVSETEKTSASETTKTKE